MQYIYYVIIGIVILIYIFIYYIYYINNSLSSFNDIISTSYKDSIQSNGIYIYGGTFLNCSLYKLLDGIEYLQKIPTIVFLNNLIQDEIVNTSINKTLLDFPANNMIDEMCEYIYGGWFIGSNAHIDAICVRSNNLNSYRRYSEEDVTISYFKNNSSDENDHIILLDLIYINKRLILINICKIIKNDPLNVDHYITMGKILSYIKNKIIGSNVFILFCDDGLNGKYNKLLIDSVFGDTVVHSCYDGSITYVDDTSTTQSTFICMEKTLCPNGVKFGLRYPNSEPTMNTELFLYCLIFENTNENEYFNDALSMNILNSIKSSKYYKKEYIEWNLIDTSNLLTTFEYDDNTLITDDLTYSKKDLDTVIANLNNS